MSRSDFVLKQEVLINDILLDPKNPRIRSGSSQTDCIDRVLRKEEQMLRLIASIAENGLSTNPILLMPTDSGKWIVKDGNRRITSLKLLNNPELCKVESLREKIITIRQKHLDNIPDRIDCLVSDNQKAIEDEVISRHSGALGGAGQVDWSSYLRTIYLINSGHPAEYKKAAQYLSWAESNKIPVDDDFPITSISRFFSEDNLAALGFNIIDDKLEANISEDKIIKMAHQVVSDFQTKRKTVNDIYSPQQALQYLDEVRRNAGLERHPEQSESASVDLLNPGRQPDMLSHPKSKDPVQNDRNSDEYAPQSDQITPAVPRSPRAPVPQKPAWDRKKLFWKSSPCPKIPSSEIKARTIIHDIGKINSEDATLAVTMLMRGLVELSVGYYREKNSIKDQSSLAKNLTSCADKMFQDSKIHKSQLELLKAYSITSKEQIGILNIDTLQKYLHRDTHIPNKQTIHTFWDEICFFIGLCWE